MVEFAVPLTLVPTIGKWYCVPSGSSFRIFDALANAEIASPFHDTMT